LFFLASEAFGIRWLEEPPGKVCWIDSIERREDQMRISQL